MGGAPIVDSDDAIARAATEAIQSGDVDRLRRLLRERPDLARTYIREKHPKRETFRTLLHVATDWPGHFPNGPATVSALVEAGADVNAPVMGPHSETPLHWAASSNDVAVVDALLACGANIEAPGAVIGGGAPLADAVAFGQWEAARRLVERGASSNLWQSAALGLMDRVRMFFQGSPPPQDELDNAFWCACHGGKRASAEYLLERGANINWTGHNGLTPIDAAQRSGADDLTGWLRGLGAKSAKEPG